MKSGSVKIIDRISAVEAIKQLDEDDLRFLNRLIVERLKLISQAKSTSLMANFSRGDRVGFQTSDGDNVEGIVLRLNKKTISITTDDGQQWNVTPGLLRLIQSAGDVQIP
jgi:transcription elongation factor